MAYFEQETTPTGVDGIKAIWVASDDPDVVHEVRFLAPAYFPNVLREAIVYVSDGVTGGSNTKRIHQPPRARCVIRHLEDYHAVPSIR